MSTKRLVASLVFTAIIFAELAYAGAVLKPAKPLWPGYLSLPRNSLDVVVFGNSHVFDGIDPMVFWQSRGIAGYAMAGPRQPLQLTQHYVREALKTQRPKVAVVEVSSLAYDGTAYDTQFQQTSIGYMPLGENKISAALFDTPARDRSSMLLDIWTYHTRWNELKPTDFRLANRYAPGDFVMKGYTPLMKAREMTQTTPARTSPSASDIATVTANLRALESIAATCERHNVRLLLILTPTAPPNYNSWRLGLARTALHKRFPGVGFLDLSAPGAVPGMDWNADFFDPGHPTYAGAAKVSAKLAEYLATTYGIPDHRKDPGYAQWARDAEAHDATLLKKGATRVFGRSAGRSEAASTTAAPAQ